MITPINSPHPIDARQVAQPPAEPKPDPVAQTPPVRKSGEVSQDQVTLKSAAQPDTDRRSRRSGSLQTVCLEKARAMPRPVFWHSLRGEIPRGGALLSLRTAIDAVCGGH